ncbi:MAG: EamA family transporter, partial [Hyphomicrobiales bacterium]|nr:EamA family transporter [Hyphomicrobiales bacterium]
MVCAVVCFACLDASAKYLNGYMATLEVVWARYTGAFLLAFMVSNPVTRPGVLTTQRPLLQIGRSTLMLLSTILNVFALRFLQLDEALSILFSTPFLIAILSGPMLGEWIGWRRWTAVLIGFAGVLVVTRPGIGGMHPAA